METKWVLFEGSFGSPQRTDRYTEDEKAQARRIASCLGRSLIENGFGLMLTSCFELTADAGNAAVEACKKLGLNPTTRIKTYLYGEGLKTKSGCGIVIRTPYDRWQDVRTHVVTESDAVIGLAGGKGTSDVLQKAVLARKPVFPIGILDGAARNEWENLTREGHYNQAKGDLMFLGNFALTPEELVESLTRECIKLLAPETPKYSNRIFIVHGWDTALENEMARFLEKLHLKPVILHERPQEGRTIFQKLNDELADVGYGFVLWTPDDAVASSKTPDQPLYRARQNVLFEHGFLIGRLGPNRVCTILKGDVEVPSDLSGIIYLKMGKDSRIGSIAFDLVKELRAAGYPVKADDLFAEDTGSESRQGVR